MTTRAQRAFLTFHRHLEQLREVIDGIGQPCWATGTTTAAVHGFDGYVLKPPFHLAVPNERAPHRVGHVVHRLRDVERIDVTTAYDVPCISPTRALIELAAIETPKRLTAALDSALRDGGTSEDFLHRRIVALRRPGRSGLTKLLGVIEGSELSRGGHSYLERAFLELLGELGYPRPQTQTITGKRGTTLIRVDCRFPDRDLVIELLGYRFHRTLGQMQVDAERLNRIQLDGLVGIQFTYTDVVTRSATMLGTLAESFATSR